MNPVFIFLVILGTIALWFLLAPLFRPVGKIVSKIGTNAIDKMNEEEERKEE